MEVVRNLRIEYDVDGSGASAPNSGGPGTPVNASLYRAGQGFTDDGALDVNGLNDCGRWATDPTRTACDPVIIGGHQMVTISRTLTVTDLNRSFDIGSAMYATGEDLQADAHATLSIILPAGLGYTSASGVFASNVPEPQVWTLLLAGVAFFSARAALARNRAPTGPQAWHRQPLAAPVSSRPALPASSAALPPAAAVLMVSVCSTQKR
jgi:hypothetical protein